MVPSVKINRQDNQVGVAPPLTGERLMVVGPATSGPYETPILCTRPADLVANFGGGKAVEEAAYVAFWTGRPILFVRTNETTAGSYGTLDLTLMLAGTSVVSAHAATAPQDDLEVVVLFPTGGTIGVAGILYQYSLDGGRNFSALTALGTASTLTLPGNAQFDFAAGTIIAGAKFSCRTSGPRWNGAQLDAAMLAGQNSTNATDGILISGSVLTNGELATIQARGAAMEAAGKGRWIVASTRIPTAGESEAAYKSALDTAFGASVADYVCLCAGSAEIQSPLSQRETMRAISAAIAARAIDAGRGKDLAEKSCGATSTTRGSLPGVAISDGNGNPKHHDERVAEGLDDSRFTTLRTWLDEPGAYVNNARVFSAPGSDYRYLQHIRVMLHAIALTKKELEKRSSADVVVDRKTGFIAEDEALDIDANVNAVLRRDVTDPREASEAKFRLNRTDNILSTFTLTGGLSVIPLGYAKQINATAGFKNPALVVVEV